MKEILLKFLESNVMDSLLVYIGGIIGAFIVGKALPQFKFQRNKLEKKYREIMPDWLEPILDKIGKRAHETIIKELLKEAQGLENNTSTDLKLALKEVVDKAVETTKINLENKVEEKIIDKALDITKVVLPNVLDKAKIEMINTPAYGLETLKDSIDNKSAVSILDRLKELPLDKNHLYNVYAELQKQDGKEVEGKLGAQIGGRF